MGILSHLSSLVSVKENVVNIKGGSNERLVVGGGDLLRTSNGRSERLHSPQALANGTEVNVDLDFVVLYEPLYTPPFGVFIGISAIDQITEIVPGTRLYLKLSSYAINILKPISI
jgi:hypothetical protein